MFVAHWLQRGLGDVLAPEEEEDEARHGENGVPAATSHEMENGGVDHPQPQAQAHRAVRVHENVDDGASWLWRFVAPDPNYVSTEPAPPMTAFSRMNLSDEDQRQQGEEAEEVTVSAEEVREAEELALLQEQVWVASQETAVAMQSVGVVWEESHSLFQLLASSSKLTDKQAKKLRTLLTQKPHVVATARAAEVGMVPDGYGPLHAAAFAGNLDALRILVEWRVGAPKSNLFALHSRNLLGGTALHVAASKGHVEVVRYLKQAMALPPDEEEEEDEEDEEGKETTTTTTEPKTPEQKASTPRKSKTPVPPIGADAPVDVGGRTPLGLAATSREASARKNILEMEQELLSPGDRSVYGKPTPVHKRCGGVVAGVPPLPYGHAQMAGLRIQMEDALCHHFPLFPPKAPDAAVGLFGVFDGHGDGGVASRHVAENFWPVLQQTSEWQNYTGAADTAELLSKAMEATCWQLEQSLQNLTETVGGTTAVVAMVTPLEIRVANIGDSRCIWIPPDSEALVEAWSCDHKPHLEVEKARVEAAGLQVVAEETAADDEHFIYKIVRNETDRLAVSRALGDFEYKAHSELPPNQQAVVCVPDVQVHARSRGGFLVLASDGVWDVLSNQDVGTWVQQGVAAKAAGDDVAPVLAQVAEELLQHCVTHCQSRDNLAVQIVSLADADGAKRTLQFSQE